MYIQLNSYTIIESLNDHDKCNFVGRLCVSPENGDFAVRVDECWVCHKYQICDNQNLPEEAYDWIAEHNQEIDNYNKKIFKSTFVPTTASWGGGSWQVEEITEDECRKILNR